MLEKLKIKNFKCFSELQLELRPFTILCGVNSGGKSSVIQAILMAQEAVEESGASGMIDLMNSRYNMELYSFREILYEDAEEEKISIELRDQDSYVTLGYFSAEWDNNLQYQLEGGELEKFRKRRKIWYLGSDRTISQYQKRGNAERLELGKENEYIAYILERGRSPRIETDLLRNYQDDENQLFATQVNGWLNYILPGNQVMAATTGAENIVSLTFGKEYRYHRTNIGYGIGFVLPIIVGGLLAARNDILIIENPELHLHPKAQSDMALFLATVAHAGVQVIVETHSDHIVHGLQKAVVDSECRIKAGQVGIYYFDAENTEHMLTMDEEAYLSDWPEDFMEQAEKDLYALRKMRLANGNKHTD